jgi:ABC-type uncharacterized transport system substrate-binding protein
MPIAAAAAAAVLSVVPAQAHPHVWIDATVAPIFDETGRLAAVREKWLLDVAYTETVLPELDVSKDGMIQETELQNALRTALWWIGSSYMTRITVGGRPVERQGAQDIRVTLTDRMGVEFTLPLAEPAAVTLGAGIDVFDPENYYAFAFGDPGIDTSGLPASCQAVRREQPNLDATAVMILKRLGLTADPAILSDPAAGFPVRVAIDCR